MIEKIIIENLLGKYFKLFIVLIGIAILFATCRISFRIVNGAYEKRHYYIFLKIANFLTELSGLALIPLGLYIVETKYTFSSFSYFGLCLLFFICNYVVTSLCEWKYESIAVKQNPN